jgi:hypothetical protein
VPTPTIATWARVGRSMSTLQNHESSLALRISRSLNFVRQQPEALSGPGGAAEGLEDPDALDGLLDIGGDLADRVLRSAGGSAGIDVRRSRPR